MQVMQDIRLAWLLPLARLFIHVDNISTSAVEDGSTRRIQRRISLNLYLQIRRPESLRLEVESSYISLACKGCLNQQNKCSTRGDKSAHHIAHCIAASCLQLLEFASVARMLPPPVEIT